MVTRAFRVVFFGTPAFAVPTLETLLEAAHAVAGVITQPDRPSGRGHRTADSPVKARAVAAGIPVLQPHSLKDPGFLDSLTALRADVGVVAAYGRILPEAVLALPPHGLINVHASLLPRYRGAAPVPRAVIAGEREFAAGECQLKDLKTGQSTTIALANDAATAAAIQQILSH